MPIFANELSMTETLFGGLVVAAIIFFVVRKAGLSNFWAGILSGLLPFIAYLAYSTSHWPGGDVLTIHFAVYIANAGLLIVFGGMQKKKENMHWAPRLIIGFFMGLLLLNAIFLSVATRGLPDLLTRFFLPNPENRQVHTGFPGVIPHDRNKLYESQVQHVEQQKNLAWNVEVQGLDLLKNNLASNIVIKLSDKQHQPIVAATITIEFWRMANSADDQTIRFSETKPGEYHAMLRLSDEGLWLSNIEILKGEAHYTLKQSITVGQ
jgi:hypothetical protein